MTPDEYQNWAMTKWNGQGIQSEFSPESNLWLEQILNASLGLMGEGGEYCDLVKKIVFHRLRIAGGGEGNDNNMKLKKELGDLAYYLAVNARLWGWSLEEIFQGNVEKLNARYPEGFDTERSNNRNEAAE